MLVENYGSPCETDQKYLNVTYYCKPGNFLVEKLYLNQNMTPSNKISFHSILIDDVNPQIFDLRSEANEVSARGDRCVASQIRFYTDI